MALVLGVNCGFVTVAPTVDPAATNTIADNYAAALKVSSPAGAVKVTEIGWWCDNATEEANFEVAIYGHNIGDDEPEAVVGWDQTNAKGTTAGWKKATGLNIEISPETIYWIVYQLDNTATPTWCNYQSNGQRKAYLYNPTALPDPWGTSSGFYTSLGAFYAVYETEAGVEHTHSASDTLAMSDSLAAAMTFNVALDDTMSISDALTAAMTFNVALSDTLSISDALAVAATYNVSLSDVLAISDALTAAATYNVALADTLQISDELVAEIILAIIKKRGKLIPGLKPARVVSAGRIGV